MFSYRFSFADQELVEHLQEWRFAQDLSAQVSVPRQLIRIPITSTVRPKITPEVQCVTDVQGHSKLM